MNAGAAASSAGGQLRQAREARGLTQDEAAEQLRIGVALVRAMEDDRFDALGAPVFARGHLRKYAVLVGLPPDEAVAAYGSEQAAAAEPTFVPTVNLKRQVRSGNRYAWPAAAIALALAVVLALWWLSERAGGATPPALPAAPQESGPGADAAVTSAESAATGNVGPPLPAAADGAGLALQLEFGGDCWLEVFDADDNRLAFDLQPAGSMLTVEGPPPFRVLIGNTSATRLAAAGRRLAIPAAAIRQNVAYFSLAADATMTPLAQAGSPGS